MNDFISVRLIYDFATPLKTPEKSRGKKRRRIEIEGAQKREYCRVALASSKIFDLPKETFWDKAFEKLSLRRWVYFPVKLKGREGERTGYMRVNRESLRKRLGIGKEELKKNGIAKSLLPFLRKEIKRHSELQTGEIVSAKKGNLVGMRENLMTPFDQGKSPMITPKTKTPPPLLDSGVEGVEYDNLTPSIYKKGIPREAQTVHKTREVIQAVDEFKKLNEGDPVYLTKACGPMKEGERVTFVSYRELHGKLRIRVRKEKDTIELTVDLLSIKKP